MSSFVAVSYKLATFFVFMKVVLWSRSVNVNKDQETFLKKQPKSVKWWPR